MLTPPEFRFFALHVDFSLEMSAATSVQDAHDALLASKPEGASHDACALCAPAGTAESTKEVAGVADGDRTFTEAEHFALLTDAVSRETASLTEAKSTLESEKAALQVQVTTLESELAAEKQAREQVEAEFAAFKGALAEMAAVAERRDARVAAVKAAAPHLPEDYFTAERADTWAAMTEEVFAGLTEGLETAASAAKSEEPPVEGAPAAETAAFKGGVTPAAPETKGSTFTQFLGARRGAAASA